MWLISSLHALETTRFLTIFIIHGALQAQPDLMKWQLLLNPRGGWTMAQHISEHPASYLAEAVVILMIIISVLYMVKEWGG